MGVFVDRLSFLAYSIDIYGFAELVSGYIDIQGEPRYTLPNRFLVSSSICLRCHLAAIGITDRPMNSRAPLGKSLDWAGLTISTGCKVYLLVCTHSDGTVEGVY